MTSFSSGEGLTGGEEWGVGGMGLRWEVEWTGAMAEFTGAGVEWAGAGVEWVGAGGLTPRGRVRQGGKRRGSDQSRINRSCGSREEKNYIMAH